jgi:hypothetical protein
VLELRHPNRHFIIGVLIVLLGFILLLDQLGFVEANKVFLFWPLVLIYFGLNKFFGSHDMVGRFWGGFLSLLGISFQLEELGISHIRFGTIWPVFLICVGVLLILRRYESGSASRYGPPVEPPPGATPPSNDPPPPGSPTPTPATSPADFDYDWREASHSWRGAWHEHNWSNSSAPRLDELNIFWGGRRRVVTKNFRGGEIITIFGGFEIDLREADIQGDIAQIEIVTIFGGGEIRIPANWSVVLETVGIFGGATDRTLHPEEPNRDASGVATASGPRPKKLIIKGVCIFGGINLKN